MTPCVEFGTRSLTLPAMISCGRRRGSPVDGRTLSAFKQTPITVTENRTCVSPPYVDSGPPLLHPPHVSHLFSCCPRLFSLCASSL